MFSNLECAVLFLSLAWTFLLAYAVILLLKLNDILQENELRESDWDRHVDEALYIVTP